MRPGGRVPADGRIVQGSASMDESMITGQARPVRRSDGDPPIAGTSDRAQATVGDLMLVDLRRYMSARLTRRGKDTRCGVRRRVRPAPHRRTATPAISPHRCPKLPGRRASDYGLPLSPSPARKRRCPDRGPFKAPEDIVTFAGTAMRRESSGSATGEELRSARAQRTYGIPPDDVRRAAVGNSIDRPGRRNCTIPELATLCCGGVVSGHRRNLVYVTMKREQYVLRRPTRYRFVCLPR